MKSVFACRNTLNTKNGFLNVELLIGSFMVMVMLMGVLLTFSEAVKAAKHNMATIEITENGRFVRQVLVHKIRFARQMPMITDGGKELRVSGNPAWIITQKSRQLYKRLSDGQHQPYTGNAINNLPATYGLVDDGRELFTTDRYGGISFRYALGSIGTSALKLKEPAVYQYNVDINILPYCVFEK